MTPRYNSNNIILSKDTQPYLYINVYIIINIITYSKCVVRLMGYVFF